METNCVRSVQPKRRVINQNSSNVSQHQKLNLVLMDFTPSLFRVLSLSLPLSRTFYRQFSFFVLLSISLSLSFVINFTYETKSTIFFPFIRILPNTKLSSVRLTIFHSYELIAIRMIKMSNKLLYKSASV